MEEGKPDASRARGKALMFVDFAGWRAVGAGASGAAVASPGTRHHHALVGLAGADQKGSVSGRTGNL